MPNTILEQIIRIYLFIYLFSAYLRISLFIFAYLYSTFSTAHTFIPAEKVGHKHKHADSHPYTFT